MPLDYLQAVCAYWRDSYDWRSRNTLLNRHAQFRTTIDGLGIHFMRMRSPQAQAQSLVMTHGWPGSTVEFQKVIAPLTDPLAHGSRAEDAFRLVCSRLPGYGFSDKPVALLG